jgi:hypothetical protein
MISAIFFVIIFSLFNYNHRQEYYELRARILVEDIPYKVFHYFSSKIILKANIGFESILLLAFLVFSVGFLGSASFAFQTASTILFHLRFDLWQPCHNQLTT